MNKKKLLGVVATTALFCTLATTPNVEAARTDMVDVSNHNGDMTVANFQDMHNNYGVKAAVTKISEGTTYKDAYAANNIKTAQAAGLFIHGYHYAHYSNVSEAIAEANFAAQTAKADGLPSGSVLVTDVESTEQQHNDPGLNTQSNIAFINQVAKYGYRSDIYTMGSWVDTVMQVKKGWIAAYPSDATDQYWYPSSHGWQWTSHYQFDGSYGYFDVSQLYDNYFTSYQAPQTVNLDNANNQTNNSSNTTNNAVSSKGVINVQNANGSYVPLVAIQGNSTKTITNRALANNTPWVTDQTKTIDGVTYHRVATNEWVDAKYII